MRRIRGQGGKLANAVEHLELCCEVYAWQAKRGKFFLYLHPWMASSWSKECIVKVLQLEGVAVRRADQCQFGLTFCDGEGKCQVEKATGWVSNCEEILAEVGIRCDDASKVENDRRRHVHVMDACAKAPESYPVRLIRAILRGLSRCLRTLPGAWIFVGSTGARQ